MEINEAISTPLPIETLSPLTEGAEEAIPIASPLPVDGNEEIQTEEITESTLESVSGGDSTDYESALAKEILTLIQENNELLSTMNEENETQTLTIWEKPLEDYTVEESFDLLLFVLVCFLFVYHIVGGIITCN